MRLFLALWPDQTLRQRMHEAARSAVASSGARAISADDLHLTLAFLGSVADEARTGLEDAVDRVAAAHAPFELALGRIGNFERARALWLGGTATPDLRALLRNLNQELTAVGHELDRRRFQPHVTVARDLKQAGDGIGEADLGLGALKEPLIWPVRGITLVASEVGPEGSQYQRLREWPLSGEDPG
jgi:RNA 2',3'-cyclic 3'-phosphodiesterase